MSKILFWISVSIIIYTYLGYPILLYLVSIFFSKPVNKNPVSPYVSIIISAYNEEGTIERKINNCLTLDYPKDKMEILIGSDGSTDTTNTILEKYSKEIGIFIFKQRRGKASVLNDLITHARGEILFFTDARQVLDLSVLKLLTRNFYDKSIGSVSGELMLRETQLSTAGKDLAMYWDYEKFLRTTESKLYSMLGATGAIYAIKKELVVTIPHDILLDDVFIPLKIIDKGFRAIFEPEARAYDNVAKNAKQEYKRKVRTLAGNWQIFLRTRNLFNPLQSKIAIQLLSHKLLRVLIPYFLIIVFIANAFLLNIATYRIFFLLQSIFYVIALIGLLLSKFKLKYFSLPYTFCVLNIAAIQGLYYFLTHKQKVTWSK